MGENEQLSENSTNVASHDEPVADAFGEFMAQGWALPSGELPLRNEVADYTVLRRAALVKAFPNETLIIPTGTFKVRANDTDYPFRPGSDFYWLTGCIESDAILVLANGESMLFLPDRSDRSTPEFYRDRRYGELWVGPRQGVKETEAALGITCRPLVEFAKFADDSTLENTRILRGFDQEADKLATDSERDRQLAIQLSELRLLKDEFEIARLKEAVAATVTGFEECVRELGRAAKEQRGERWIEGTFWRRARLDGNDVGYGSIVACGHHATTLHWVRNDGAVKRGELALLDMGVESNAMYTADVTRTLPIDGHFTDAQRRVYDVVYRAQREAIEAVKPGVMFLEPHRVAMRVIAEALEEWGLLTVSAEESLRPDSGLHRRYTLHGTSHMLGLDVHDCAEARNETYYQGVLQAGMVLTVEPGLYFQIDDMTVPEELRGIGVRIEDDVLVTSDGSEVLSAALPTQADEIEAWMASIGPGWE